MIFIINNIINQLYFINTNIFMIIFFKNELELKQNKINKTYS